MLIDDTLCPSSLAASVTYCLGLQKVFACTVSSVPEARARSHIERMAQGGVQVRKPGHVGVDGCTHERSSPVLVYVAIGLLECCCIPDAPLLRYAPTGASDACRDART